MSHLSCLLLEITNRRHRWTVFMIVDKKGCGNRSKMETNNFVNYYHYFVVFTEEKTAELGNEIVDLTKQLASIPDETIRMISTVSRQQDIKFQVSSVQGVWPVWKDN
jgi:hypothetical protein